MLIYRRAVEIFAEDENKGEFISTEHINSAIKEMNSSKTAITVKHFSLHKQVFLLACLMSIRKNGTSETNFGAVADEHRSLCGLARLLYPTIPMLYSLCGSLADSRLIIAENQRGGTPQQKIKLNCDENDIIAGIRQSTNHTKLKSVIKRY
jgi:Cdc6-like AAA superfamily ATPase